MIYFEASVYNFDNYEEIICESQSSAEKAICKLFYKFVLCKFTANNIKKLDIQNIKLLERINNLLIEKDYKEASNIIIFGIYTLNDYTFTIKKSFSSSERDIEVSHIDSAIISNALKEIVFK